MRRNLFLVSAFMFLFSIQGFSQTDAELKYDRERYEKKANEMKAELTNDIIEELKVDAFEKVIITQSINSYFKEVTKIYKFDVSSFEKQDLVTKLDARHFNDLKTILDQEQIDFILNQIKGEWKKNQKKKKKKKKRKNNN